jgi:hypothetical protein
MNPYRDERVLGGVRQFLDRFYGDDHPRLLVLGINPGRFGGGATGIAFTDPIALSDHCGIQTHLPRHSEVSSQFVYRVIAHMGGVASFFSRFFLSAVSPLGFTRGGANLNYYDDPHLELAVTPFIVETLRQQIDLGGRRDVALIIGRGQNLEFVEALNAEHRFFDRLEALDHPRYIMQYRRVQLDEYIRQYSDMLGSLAT